MSPPDLSTAGTGATGIPSQRADTNDTDIYTT